ncbi:MAG: hypothetical protein WC592_00225 [Candidatus Omnitrophota bacterium]|nr:hypothetical protein [Candidatus Omnitrophota bacterium]
MEKGKNDPKIISRMLFVIAGVMGIIALIAGIICGVAGVNTVPIILFFGLTGMVLLYAAIILHCIVSGDDDHPPAEGVKKPEETGPARTGNG